MSNVLYDSGLLDFANDESECVLVEHTLGQLPPAIQFYGDLDGELGFPTLLDENDIEIDGPYLEDTSDLNAIKVYKPNAYEYAGKFRIVIYG
jgi:hypothetical protein